MLCNCSAARGGLVGHRSVTPIGPGAMLGQGAARGQLRRRCGVPLEVLCERCAVEGRTLRLPRAAPRPARQSPCEGTGKAGRRGPASACGVCGALQLELVGVRCAAPAALLPCESPPVPRRVRGVRGCHEGGQREPRGARALGRQEGWGAGRCRRRRESTFQFTFRRRARRDERAEGV